jgi:hypothetical protein
MGKKSKKRKQQAEQIHLHKTEIKKSTPVRANNKILFMLLGGVAFLLYINTAGHGYVYDDFSVITGNKITAKGLAGIPEILKTSYWYGMTGNNDAMYRPFSLITFAIENQVSKDNASLSHVVNILLYVLTSLLLLRLLLKIFSNYHKFIPFMVALLWVVHPLHTEVIANIKSRDEIMSFLFGILAIQFMVFSYEESKIKSLLLGGLFYFFALLSKENAITYLAVIPVTVYFICTSRKQILYSILSLGIFTVAYTLIRQSVLHSEITEAKLAVFQNALQAAPDAASRYATCIKILALYIIKFLFPVNLSSDYSFNQIPIINFAGLGFFLSFFLLSGMLVYALAYARKKSLQHTVSCFSL